MVWAGNKSFSKVSKEMTSLEEKHTNVPPLSGNNAKEEEGEEHAAANPAVRFKGSRFVEMGLINLYKIFSQPMILTCSTFSTAYPA